MPDWMRLLLYFLYFKIASQIALDPGFGLFAAAVFAIVYEVTEFCCNLWVTVLTNPYDPVGRKFYKTKTVLFQTRLVIFAFVIPVTVLLAIGFAPGSIQFDSSRWLDNALNHPGEWLVPFSIIMLIPLIVVSVFPRKLIYDFPPDDFDK